nr:micos subunit mic26 [Quercus suber]
MEQTIQLQPVRDIALVPGALAEIRSRKPTSTTEQPPAVVRDPLPLTTAFHSHGLHTAAAAGENSGNLIECSRTDTALAHCTYGRTHDRSRPLSQKHGRIRKPIYDAPTNPSVREIAATTPIPASGITTRPQEDTKPSTPRKPTPADRLAKQIKAGRLFLHGYAVSMEDAVNGGMDRFMSAEHSFTSTIASLAPPKESNEKLLPGSIYVLVAAMAGSIISRNRNILIRFVTPIVTGVTTANYVVPRTTENVGNLIWEFEKKYPVVRDNHLRASEGVRHFVQTGIAHSQMGLAMAEEKVTGVREAVEDWVKKGR